MYDLNKQAPAPTTTETPTPAPDSTTPATAPVPATTSAFSGDYLSNGYYASAENGAKYLKKEYIGEYAREIAAGLSGMKPLEFEKMVRELKRNKKRTLPYEARQTAVAEMLPAAKNLVRHKKAPSMLVEFIQRNLEEIRDDETWTAFYRHCQAISGYME